MSFVKFNMPKFDRFYDVPGISQDKDNRFKFDFGYPMEALTDEAQIAIAQKAIRMWKDFLGWKIS